MNEIAQNILDTVHVGALATVHRDNSPLVTPLHFAVLGDTIIWISSLSSRHARNALDNKYVEFVVWDATKRAVYLRTKVTILPEHQKDEAMKAFAAKHGDFMPKFDDGEIFTMPIGHIDENSTTGNWLHYIA